MRRRAATAPLLPRLPVPDLLCVRCTTAHLEFIRRAYPHVIAYTSGFAPPLALRRQPLRYGVFRIGVFHLHPDDHVPWLRELSRVVRPGGYAFLTIEGATAMGQRMATKVWRENPDEGVAVLERDGVRFAEYDDLGWHKAHEDDKFTGAKYAVLQVPTETPQ